MATDLEKLVVSLEASINKYEKTLARAATVSDQRAKQVESRWAKINLGRDVFGPMAKSALAAILPALSLAAAISKTKEALADFGDIADNAAAAGLDPELYQSLTFQFRQVGVETNQSAGALSTFAKNSGLAVEGKGKMVTALKALNPELLENIRRATTQAERIRIVADALGNEEDSARRAAIATALFGDAGVKMVAAFDGGAKTIDDTLRRAKDLGLVIDRDLIARADKLGDEFDQTAEIVDKRVKLAFVQLGPVLVWLTGLAGDLAAVVAQIAGNAQAIPNRTTSMLNEQIGQIDELIKRRRAAEAALSSGDPLKMLGGAVDNTLNHGPSLEQLVAGKRQIERELFQRGEQFSLNQLKIVPPADAELPSLDEIESQNEAAAATVKHAEAVKGLIANLQFEQEQLGRTSQEQELYNYLKQVGVERNSAEGRAIEAVLVPLQKQREAFERNTAALESLGDTADQALQSLVDAFSDGKLEAEELLSIVMDIVKQLLTADNIGALLSGLGGKSAAPRFLGGRASGGPVKAGGLYRINERSASSEYFVPGMDGMVVPRIYAAPPANRSARRDTQVNIYPPAGYEAREEQRDTAGGERTDVTFDRMVASAAGRKGSATQRALRSSAMRPLR